MQKPSLSSWQKKTDLEQKGVFVRLEYSKWIMRSKNTRGGGGGGEEKHRQNLSKPHKKLQVMNNHLHKASGEKRGNQKRTQTGNKVEQLLKSSIADSDKYSWQRKENEELDLNFS